MNDIYWVGPRQSDIANINFLFKGSVTIFGDNMDGNIAYCHNNIERINHNIPNDDCDNFFIKTLTMLCKKNNNISFLFYNPLSAYDYGDEIIQHTICLNNKFLLENLSDKVKCRYILSDYLNTTPFVTLKGYECTYENISKYFNGFSTYVIQKIHSSGGDGTYYVDNQTTRNFVSDFHREEDYLVSPYMEGCISLNTHIIINREHIQYFPSSIQIIRNINNKLLYYGADFICYNFINENIKKKVRIYSEKIGMFLKKKGYLGVLGIDFIAVEEDLYFMEFNPRFQASTELVNRTLIQHNISIQKLQMQAFEHNFSMQNVTPDFQVKYSNLSFTTDTVSKEYLKWLCQSNEIYEIQTDGYDMQNEIPNQTGVYMFRCIFNQNICSIFRNMLRIHPNICINEMKTILYSNPVHFKEYIKIALLNQGAIISDATYILLNGIGTIKEAVFDAIDITIFKSLHVNVPVKCKFSTISPFVIDTMNDKLFLYLDGTKISEVFIDMVPDILINKKTVNGIPFDAMLHFATDRIRINPAPVCIYKILDIACKFCNFPLENYSYSIDDIQEAIDYCLEYIDFRHFLIGGGTYSIEDDWDLIISTAKYIRSKCNKPIYLMAVPPKKLSILDDLKNAGITEVAFNLEIFDRKLAQEIMPGKGSIEFQRYLETFKYATKLWGKSGNVRSLLILGFDNENTFLNGVNHLCEIGVEPIISIFRPLMNTMLANQNPPMTDDVIKTYHRCLNIVEKYSLKLGPECPACQNNTLSYTE